METLKAPIHAFFLNARSQPQNRLNSQASRSLDQPLDASRIQPSWRGLSRSSDLRQWSAAHGSNHTMRSPSAHASVSLRLANSRQQTVLNLKPSLHRFHNTFGYGLVDAAAAVGAAVRRDRLFNLSSLSRSRTLPGPTHLWGLNRIQTQTVWNTGYTGQNVVVAVLDTGVDYTHPDLDSNIWRNTGEIPNNNRDDDGNGFVDDVRGWNFAGRNNNPIDRIDGHGTHVAGTIAAVKNNYGVTGVAYNAKIMPVKVLGDDGTGKNPDIARGIRYAADNGANVINLSLGGGFSNQVARAIRYAVKQGSVVVMASGNEGAASPLYPGALARKWGIVVGAVDRTLTVADFSNRAGSRMDYVVAPGVNIHSTFPGGRFKSLDGTSMATPHVAGIVALMLSANPTLSPTDVEDILIETANYDAVSL